MLKKTDYQEFCTIDTPLEERRKLNIGDVWLNAIRCRKCNDIIQSKNRHDMVWCKCGQVAVDGGSWYLKRSSQTASTMNTDYDELSVPFKDAHE